MTIAGQSYPHLLFQLILSHSGWRYAEVAAGETFLALQQGLQNALWTLGGVPEVVRSDNTAAATHELRSSSGRALNDNYAALLDHYSLRSTRINPGQSHENGVAEHAHYRLKDAIDQALILRGSRDFDTADDYASFVRQMVERRNRLVQGKLEQELLCLGSLPPAPVPEYVNYQSKVRKWCTIQVAGHSYSVPSRLIGKEVQIRLYADWVEVYYQGHRVERMERVRGEGEANVNYRHVIGSLVRKPGAFARYRFREQLFPTMHFRLTYDALRQWRGERADVEYVRILQPGTPASAPWSCTFPSCGKAATSPACWNRGGSEKALLAVIQQAYVEGVSTRRVDDLIKALGCDGISSSQVSRICEQLDEVVDSFLGRPLDGGPYPYVWLDGLTQKVREGGRIVNVCVVVATGVNAEGQREILGMDVGTSEDGAFWLAFLRSLTARGSAGWSW